MSFTASVDEVGSAQTTSRAFRASGRDTLFDDGMKKVKAGVTTLEEVLRVTEVYGQNEAEVFTENMR